jgi:tRNA-splicing ligase RtcB
MISEMKGKVVPVKLWTQLHEVESAALDQLKGIAALPWAFHHVAVMPDVHFGKGATVGSVIAMKEALSPAAVGVDIGCGMAAVRTNLTSKALPDSLSSLRSMIEAQIPVGPSSHEETHPLARRSTLWSEFKNLDESVKDKLGNAQKQLGTLGGGNHFIELCLDTDDCVWLMLHSGSRNIGKCLAEVHIARAKKLAHNAELPDKDLAVFLAKTPEMAAYRRDLFWSQRYAKENREVMLAIYQDILRKVFDGVSFDEPISCHHNYVSEEHHFGEDVIVTRKGAISARTGERGIIPGSMGTCSYIVRGLGNPDSFHSASHGAGRRMSRGEAKRKFTLDDLAAATKGVECRKDGGVIDEIPGAYKDIDAVMDNQSDLVEIEAQLKQILCVKG